MATFVDSGQALFDLLIEIRNSKKKIAMCHGVFDLLHPGHLEHFHQASNLADVLIVSTTADNFVNKGPGRPVFDLHTRMLAISRIKGVDHVIASNHPTALQNLELVKPDFYVKGSDYNNFSNDITGMIDKEAEYVSSYGGQIYFTSGFTSSSTMLINNSLLSQDSDIRKWVRNFREKWSLDETLYWIDKMKEVEVNVLGETIIDIYTACKPLAKSSKDPILAFHRFETDKFPGGVLAIGDSCEKWSKKTTVFSASGEDLENHLAEIPRKWDFDLRLVTTHDRPTIAKHRYYDVNSGNRVFEHYDFNPEPLSQESQSELIHGIEGRLEKDAVFLIADYGHGLFTEVLIDKLVKSNSFLAVNTQANAGNRGFNTIAKYPRIDFLSLNGGELELELRKKNLNYGEVVPEIMSVKKSRNAVLTLGGDGLLTFDENKDMCWTPAFASKVVDKVGAGDSVLAVASILSSLRAPKEIIGLISSVVAAFEVAQLGHAKSLDIITLKKNIKGLLG